MLAPVIFISLRSGEKAPNTLGGMQTKTTGTEKSIFIPFHFLLELFFCNFAEIFQLTRHRRSKVSRRAEAPEIGAADLAVASGNRKMHRIQSAQTAQTALM
ncbi:hypothetical protein [Pseudomonas sp. LB3P14]